MKILLVEDEKITRISLSDTLSEEGYSVTACATGREALEQLEAGLWDVLITDLRLPRTSGIDILRAAREKFPDITAIVMTAYATVETAIEALKLGAYDYITKPFAPDKLLSMLKHISDYKRIESENRLLKARLHDSSDKGLVFISPEMIKLEKTLKAVAPGDYTVLIEGESGTGKEITARSLHSFSSRNRKPFLAVNCAAIPESLLESELFGHEKGAFTGADRQHKGYFERAEGGTIFIDDIDDFPINLQVKLLRVLQEKELVRVGGSQLIKVNVRVIAASKTPLKELVRAGSFREDLYYRLNIIPITIPPLRRRTEDIPALVEFFFQKYGAADKLKQLTSAMMARLEAYSWPGNVRELENFVERLIAYSSMGAWSEQLFDGLNTDGIQETHSVPAPAEKEPEIADYRQYMDAVEMKLLNSALERCGGNISRAAEMLGLPRSTLRSKLKSKK